MATRFQDKEVVLSDNPVQLKLSSFEENDLCERAKNEGYKLVCADDTFVYHHGKSSFIFLGEIDERRAINRDILIDRWPHYQKEVFEFCRRNPLRPIQERIINSL